MWWSRLVSAAVVTVLAAGLSGCFQPLYGEAAHPGLVENVRAIEVEPINTRFGHYFVEDLRTELNGTGQEVTPKYRLTVQLSTSTQTPTVNTQINVASSATVTADAAFTLVRLSDNKEVFKDKAFAVASYDRTTQRYAGLRAARDAELRLSRTLAQEISIRIAGKLSANPS
jgi:LPS-assembly lipoprotein